MGSVPSHASRITPHESSRIITNHGSRITNHGSRITNHSSRFTLRCPYDIVLVRPLKLERKSDAADRDYLQRAERSERRKAILAGVTQSSMRILPAFGIE